MYTVGISFVYSDQNQNVSFTGARKAINSVLWLRDICNIPSFGCIEDVHSKLGCY